MQVSTRYLPSKRSKFKSLLLVILLLILYLLENSPISNYILPIFWLSAIVFISQIRNIRPSEKLKYRQTINFWAFYFALFFIIINLFAGLIAGFGRSPYNHSLIGIINNIILVGTPLVGRELIRSYVINSWTKKEKFLILICMAIIMTITSFSFNRYTSIASFTQLVEFSGQYFFPQFSNNILASFLVFLGGPISSIIYLGLVEGFHWLSPILPDIKWISQAFIGTLSPAVFMMILYYLHYSHSGKLKKREDDENPLGWILTGIAAIGIIWFTVGVFPIYPSVVATGSMEPIIMPGDVILVEKIVDMEGIETLKEDDIIMYRREEAFISHRIVGIFEGNEGIRFRTKGDNNSREDSQLVGPEDIRGIIRYRVPKLGWPTLLLKSDKDINLEDYEF